MQVRGAGLFRIIVAAMNGERCWLDTEVHIPCLEPEYFTTTWTKLKLELQHDVIAKLELWPERVITTSGLDDP
ncbi:hypothetical protein B0T45_21430 [Chromobacterium haemolyticum]|uniref:Uncharacterized protein n=1 Tax=Chromobacterium haemolyticum TaxID=394935 RepID=A0A1W0CDB4_9NEIS|nr:hypothetical protein B0T45_21430 [Chromobacterium haemolyticum]